MRLEGRDEPRQVALSKIRAVATVDFDAGHQLQPFVVQAATDQHGLILFNGPGHSLAEGAHRKEARALVAVRTGGGNEDELLRIIEIAVAVSVNTQPARRPAPHDALAFTAIGLEAIEVHELLLAFHDAAGFTVSEAKGFHVGSGHDTGLVAGPAVLDMDIATLVVGEVLVDETVTVVVLTVALFTKQRLTRTQDAAFTKLAPPTDRPAGFQATGKLHRLQSGRTGTKVRLGPTLLFTAGEPLRTAPTAGPHAPPTAEVDTTGRATEDGAISVVAAGQAGNLNFGETATVVESIARLAGPSHAAIGFPKRLAGGLQGMGVQGVAGDGTGTAMIRLVVAATLVDKALVQESVAIVVEVVALFRFVTWLVTVAAGGSQEEQAEASEPEYLAQSHRVPLRRRERRHLRPLPGPLGQGSPPMLGGILLGGLSGLESDRRARAKAPRKRHRTPPHPRRRTLLRHQRRHARRRWAPTTGASSVLRGAGSPQPRRRRPRHHRRPRRLDRRIPRRRR
jgi:hypothetical protein